MNEVYLALGSVVAALGVILGLLLVRAFLKTEFWAKNKAKYDMFKPFVEGAIIQVADAFNSGMDMAVYEEKALKWKQEKGIDLDPRMWAVLDKIDTNPMFSGFLEFDTVVTLVEGIYQKLRKEDNGLILNPEKDIPVEPKKN